MEDEGDVQDLGHVRVRLLFGQHVEKVLCMAEVIPGLYGLIAVPHPRKGRHNGGKLCNETYHGPVVRSLIGHILGRVEHPEGCNRCLEGIHRMAMFGKALYQVYDPVLYPPVMPQVRVEPLELVLRGELAEDQQIGRLNEAAPLYQFLHPDTPVLEDALLPIDEAYHRLGSRYPFKAWYKVDHLHLLMDL